LPADEGDESQAVDLTGGEVKDKPKGKRRKGKGKS
jgi:hypothetical protein